MSSKRTKKTKRQKHSCNIKVNADGAIYCEIGGQRLQFKKNKELLRIQSDILEKKSIIEKREKEGPILFKEILSKASTLPKNIQLTTTKKRIPQLARYIGKRRKSTIFKIVQEPPKSKTKSNIPERQKPTKEEYAKRYIRKDISISDKRPSPYELREIILSLKHNTLKYLSLNKVELYRDIYTIAKALETNKSLIELNIINSLKDEPDGIIAIGETLLKNNFLKSLSLSNNNITDDILDELIYVLGENKTLIKVDLSNNDITNEGADRLYHMLAETFNFLIEVKLTGNEISKNIIEKIKKILAAKSKLLFSAGLQ